MKLTFFIVSMFATISFAELIPLPTKVAIESANVPSIEKESPAWQQDAPYATIRKNNGRIMTFFSRGNEIAKYEGTAQNPFEKEGLCQKISKNISKMEISRPLLLAPKDGIWGG